MGGARVGSAARRVQPCFAVRNGALAALAVNEEGEMVIADKGGIELIVGALANHGGRAQVCERACGALLNIGWSQKELQQRIKKAGAKELVQQVIAALGPRDTTAISRAESRARLVGLKLLEKLEGM